MIVMDKTHLELLCDSVFCCYWWSAYPDVPGCDSLREGQALGKVGGYPNLPRGQVGVR